MAFLVVTSIVRRDGEVLMIRQQAPHDPAAYWYLPGGVVEDDEFVREAHLRELREETGLEAEELGTLGWISHVRRTDDSYVVLAHEIIGPTCDPVSLDPDSIVTEAQFVPIETAISWLGQCPFESMRDPAVAYLERRAAPGSLWQWYVGSDGAYRLATSPLV